MAPLKLATMCALVLTLASAACSNPHAYDCNEACNLYRDCIDGEYDTQSCENRCEAMAGSDSTYGDQVTACHACEGSGICVDAGAFTCADTCTGVVP